MKTVTAKPMMLLPPHPDACQVCARKHEPWNPHDAQSLYWAVARKMEGKPAPTWKLAMKHCLPAVKKIWKKELRLRGVKI